MKKALSLLLAVLVLVALFAGCGGDTTPSAAPSGEPEAEPSTTPSIMNNDDVVVVGEEPEGIVPGSVLNIAWDSDKQTHLPYSSDSHGALYLMIYDTLFQNNDGEITGLIAKDWTVSEDGMEYVINIWDNIDYCLKDGSKGDHVTADKVVRSLQLTEKYMANYFENIESYEATGEYEITVKFSAPYPDFEAQFSMMFTGIVDPDYVAEHGEESNDSAVGTGPYYIADYEGATSFTFKANPYYWNEDRFAHIETINCSIIPEMATRQVALLSGDIDWFECADVTIVSALTQDPAISAYICQGAFNPLYFNCNRAPFDNENVRRGLGLLINSEELVNVAYGGQGNIYDSPWQEGAVTYKEYEGVNEYNPEEGLRLLEEAGVDPSSLVLNTFGSYLDSNYLPALQAQLMEYGITLNFEIYEPGTFIQTVGQGDWDVMAWFGLLDKAAPYQSYLNMFGENGFYRCLFIDETYPEIWQQIQDLLAEAGQCTTIDEQVEVLTQIDQILVDNCFFTHNVGGNEWRVYNSKLQNMQGDAKYQFTEFYELYWAE